MIWNEKNTQAGEIVASQTTSGDFKDLAILTVADGQWQTVSLLDGLQSEPAPIDQFLSRLNDFRFVPCAKILSSQHAPRPFPENRAGLPMVAIVNLRNA